MNFVKIFQISLFILRETATETQLVISNDCESVHNSHRFTDVLQAKGVLKFIEAISEKTLRSTVALTAARGRGKSAALGLAVAGAVAFGYGFAVKSHAKQMYTQILAETSLLFLPDTPIFL